MRFTRCFTSTAMCAPTRQQLYTGLYPVRNGAYPNQSRVKPGTKSLAHYLKNLGYRVGIAGKKHYGPPESFPFETIAGEAEDYAAIEQFINRDKSQPYCLLVTSTQPHLPWTKGRAEDYDPQKLSVPAYMVDTPETRKASLYDTGIRTAFIIRWPKKIKAASVTDAMVQYVDVTPTLTEAGGGKEIPGLDGLSFLPVLLGQKNVHRDVTYGVHTTRGIHSGSECYPIRSIRTATHKYIMNLNHRAEFSNNVTKRDNGGFWKSWVEEAKTDADAARRVEMYVHRPAEELYNLQRDPYELSNLADDPKYRALMDSLRTQLLAWMDRQGDKGLETEMLAFERQGRKKSSTRGKGRGRKAK
jgi:uncharacterized sulfatase